jgi:tryptophan-rich sensory protein
MASKLKAFAAFWYDFLIGDDWRVAAGVVIALALTAAASRANIAAWWILPVAVALLLPMTVWRATRSGRG